MKTRILHVLDKLSVESGVSSVVMNYYKKLDHENITFDFMLNENIDAGTRDYIESKGSKIYIMPQLKFVNFFKYMKALKNFYEKSDYKIIHGHVANSAVFYLGLAKNIPYRIIHSHNTRAADALWKRVRNWILTRFIGFVSNRHAACSNAAAEFLFGKNNNALILNNAIDIDEFLFDAEIRESMRGKYGMRDKFVIGHAGRFCPQKNHIFLIDCFNDIYKNNNNARLLLIGNGELYHDIMQKTENLNLKKAVLFAGATDDVRAYMNAMDVFVLPSLFEGLPVVAVEAQASGLPVILSEKITRESDITGNIVFLPLEKNLWVDEIQAVRRQDRTAYGTKVKGSCFDINTQVEKLCVYYEELLKNRI